MNIIRFGHKTQKMGTVPMPSTIHITDEKEDRGFRIQLTDFGELIVTKFDHNGNSTMLVQPNTANQITLT